MAEFPTTDKNRQEVEQSSDRDMRNTDHNF